MCPPSVRLRGQGARVHSAMTSRMVAEMASRTARKLNGGAKGRPSRAKMKPVDHSTTNSAGSAMAVAGRGGAGSMAGSAV